MPGDSLERFNRETAAKPSRINRLKLTPATVPTAWIRRSQGHADTATSDEGSRLLANFVKSPGGRARLRENRTRLSQGRAITPLLPSCSSKLTERFVHLVAEKSAPIGNLGEQVIQAGNDHDAHHGAHEHSAG